MTSTRWQNWKTRPSSSHRHTTSTPVLGPVSFVWNPETIQEASAPLTSTKPASLKLLRKLVALSCHSPTHWHTTLWSGGNPQFPASSQGRKGYTGPYVHWSGFLGCCLRDWLLSHLSESTDGTWHAIDTWGTLRTRELDVPEDITQEADTEVWWSLPQREEEWECVSSVLAFQGLPRDEYLCSPVWGTDGTGHRNSWEHSYSVKKYLPKTWNNHT